MQIEAALADADAAIEDIVPEEWSLVPLHRVCRLHKQTVHPGDHDSIPYVGLEHITPGNPRLTTWGISSDVRSAKTYFHPNQVLYGKLRPYLDKAVLSTMEGVCSTDILVFKSTPESRPDYLVYLLHTTAFLAHATSTMSGVNHPRTSWTSLAQFPVFLPPLAEQRRIAAVLNTIQEAIAAQEDVIAAARTFKRSLMHRLFTYGPGPVPAETKETEIGEIPAHWEVVELGRLVEVKGGKRLPKGSEYAGNITDHPYIRVIDFSNLSIDQSNLQFISEDIYRHISRYIITSADVYISIAGTIGLVGTIPDKLSGSNLTENAARLIILDGTNLDKWFLAQWLSAPIGQDQIQIRATKTSQPKLALMRIKQVPIALPSIKEQQEIVNMLLSLDAKIAAEEDRKAALEALFKSMLHQLMTGQIRLRNDDGLQLAEERCASI